MRKEIVENGVVLASEYHRTSLAPDTDSAVQIAAVNAHLAQLGYPSVEAKDVEVLDAAIAPLKDHRAAKAVELAKK
jgi:hypothetical protein